VLGFHSTGVVWIHKRRKSNNRWIQIKARKRRKENLSESQKEGVKCGWRASDPAERARARGSREAERAFLVEWLLKSVGAYLLWRVL